MDTVEVGAEGGEEGGGGEAISTTMVLAEEVSTAQMHEQEVPNHSFSTVSIMLGLHVSSFRVFGREWRL